MDFHQDVFEQASWLTDPDWAADQVIYDLACKFTASTD